MGVINELSTIFWHELRRDEFISSGNNESTVTPAEKIRLAFWRHSSTGIGKSMLLRDRSAFLLSSPSFELTV